MTKRVLCYGDSNTWGFDPVSKKRIDYQERWTGLLQNELGEAYQVLEEGLNGRTTVWNDPIEGYKNGLEYLVPCIESHSPLDLIIVMLGTNDIKKRFSLSAYDIGAGLSKLVNTAFNVCDQVQDYTPEILIVSPLHLTNLQESWLGEMFDFENGSKTSRRLHLLYEDIAKQHDCYYMNAADVTCPSMEDGVHFDRLGHKLFADAVSKIVKAILA